MDGWIHDYDQSAEMMMLTIRLFVVSTINDIKCTCSVPYPHRPIDSMIDEWMGQFESISQLNSQAAQNEGKKQKNRQFLCPCLRTSGAIQCVQ